MRLAEEPTDRPPDLARADDQVGAEFGGQTALGRVLGGGHDRAGCGERPDGGDGEQAQRARAQHGDDGVVGDVGEERGVDGAGGWLDHHRCLVVEGIVDRVELTGVGGEGRGPAAAGVVAGAGLDAGLEVAERGVFAVAEPSVGAGTTGGGEVAADAAQHGFEHDAGAVLPVADDLVAGHERERHEWFEVAGGAAVDGGQVGAADAGQPGQDPDPVGTGGRRRVEVGQPERAHAGTAAGREAAGQPCGGVAGQVAPELERLHRARAFGGARGRGLRCMPGDLRKSSTSHPRLRAMAARRVSGLTATGKPTASSMGRSLAESA